MMDLNKDLDKIYSLSQLADLFRTAIFRAFPEPFWMQAEIAKLNMYPRSGHVYLDLVEKAHGMTQAQMRGIIWANDFQEIRQKFEQNTGEPFREGLDLLFQARVNYHPVYGLSLWISDVDPAFTMGELSRQKIQTIARLHEEQLFGLNRQLPIPALPLHIAVISAETSKGYLDFLQVIRSHPIPYRFEITLFPALLQGDKAVGSIREQMMKVQGSRVKVSGYSGSTRKTPGSDFDLVAIIRGGGDEVGMACFDNYELARDICNFPLPVVTGIGHSTNETVVEMVASGNHITPTEVGYDLLARLDQAYETLMTAEADLRKFAAGYVASKKQQLTGYAATFHSQVRSSVIRQRSEIDHQRKTLRLLVSHFFSSRTSEISGLEDQIRQLDPRKILQRGYSITCDMQGRVIKDAALAHPGQQIYTELAQGTLKSTIDP